MKVIEIRYKADRKAHRHSDLYPYLVLFDETNAPVGVSNRCLMMQERIVDTDKHRPVRASWAMPGDHLGELITIDDLSVAQQHFINKFIEGNLDLDTRIMLFA